MTSTAGTLAFSFFSGSSCCETTARSASAKRIRPTSRSWVGSEAITRSIVATTSAVGMVAKTR